MFVHLFASLRIFSTFLSIKQETIVPSAEKRNHFHEIGHFVNCSKCIIWFVRDLHLTGRRLYSFVWLFFLLNSKVNRMKLWSDSEEKRKETDEKNWFCLYIHIGAHEILQKSTLFSVHWPIVEKTRDTYKSCCVHVMHLFVIPYCFVVSAGAAAAAVAAPNKTTIFKCALTNRIFCALWLAVDFRFLLLFVHIWGIECKQFLWVCRYRVFFSFLPTNRSQFECEDFFIFLFLFEQFFSVRYMHTHIYNHFSHIVCGVCCSLFLWTDIKQIIFCWCLFVSFIFITKRFLNKNVFLLVFVVAGCLRCV